MKCEYEDCPIGPCGGVVEIRKAMTAYDFQGERNSPEDPNRDFLACEEHYKEYEAHWKEMWDMVNQDIMEGIRMGDVDRRMAEAEDRYMMEQDRLAAEYEAEQEYGRYDRDDDGWGY